MFTVFHGTRAERSELQEILDHNCICAIDPNTSMRAGNCPAHHIVLEQRTMDGFVFERWNVKALLLEEWCLN